MPHHSCVKSSTHSSHSAGVSSSVEEWISRPQNRKTLQYQPEAGSNHSSSVNRPTNNSHNSSMIIPEGSRVPHHQQPRGVPLPVEPDDMTAFLRRAAKYGMALERYNDARHRMDDDDAGAIITRPTWDELPKFPVFPPSKEYHGSKRSSGAH